MIATLRSVLSLLIGAGLLMLGNALIGILLPIRMNAAAVTTEISGLVMSSFYFGLMLGSVFCQAIIRRVGHIRAFAAFAALLTAAFMAQALFFDILLWGLLRILTGFCMAGLYAVIESWLNVKSTNANRGQVLSLYMVTAYLSSLAGQSLINSREIGGVDLFCLGGLMTALSLVPVVLTRVAGPEIGAIRAMKLAALYRASPLGIVATAGAGLLSGGFYGMGAIFAGSLGLSVFDVSLFMGAAVFGGFALQWPIGHCSDRYDRRSVLLGILIGTVLASLAAFLFAFTPDGSWWRLLPIVVLGGGLATIYPIAIAQTFDYVDRSDMVAASSGLLLAWSIGATLGPLAASFVMGRFGPAALFADLAGIAALLALFTLWRMARRHARPAGEQINFVSLQATSAIANALDPRADPLPEFYYDDVDPGDR